MYLADRHFLLISVNKVLRLKLWYFLKLLILYISPLFHTCRVLSYTKNHFPLSGGKLGYGVYF